MKNANHKDLEAIEQLHRRDVAATMAGDFEALKSLMDEDCMVFPPDAEPTPGRAYLDEMKTSMPDGEPHEDILDLCQDWYELQLLEDFAFEQGVVRYTMKIPDGTVISESQRLMRLLRRQPDGSWRVYRAMWHDPHLTGPEQ